MRRLPMGSALSGLCFFLLPGCATESRVEDASVPDSTVDHRATEAAAPDSTRADLPADLSLLDVPVQDLPPGDLPAGDSPAADATADQAAADLNLPDSAAVDIPVPDAASPPDTASPHDAASPSDADGGSCPSGTKVTTWNWGGTTTTGWTVSNKQPHKTSTWDCCGCSGCAVTCPDNTSMKVTGSVTRFDSGPQVSGGKNHRYDGLTAAHPGVPVVPGVSHTLTIKLAALDAYIKGSTGSESSQPTWWPTWLLDVYEGTTIIGSTWECWGSAQCKSCSPKTSSLGTRTLTFKPSGKTVDVYLSLHHRSSQCSSEVYGVRADVDFIRVEANCP